LSVSIYGRSQISMGFDDSCMEILSSVDLRPGLRSKGKSWIGSLGPLRSVDSAKHRVRKPTIATRTCLLINGSIEVSAVGPPWKDLAPVNESGRQFHISMEAEFEYASIGRQSLLPCGGAVRFINHTTWPKIPIRSDTHFITISTRTSILLSHFN
ncbi:hypothetical protein KCV07_g316, partial [Aureobasidium melanogenum]